MPVVEVIDEQDNRIKLTYFDGFFFPQSPFQLDLKTHLEGVHNLQIRDDDVMICAYPKCGTHWVWEMIQMLRAGEVKYDARAKEAVMIDFMPQHLLDSSPSPRTLNSHFLFRHLPKQILEKKTKIIHLNRDPRDVAVSWYHHCNGLIEIASYKGRFVDFVPLFLHGTVAFGSWFEYVRNWEQVLEEHPDLQSLTLYYEDMKKDPAGTVKQLSQFLDLSASDELINAIAQACEFGQLRAAHDREKTDPLQFTWREGHPGTYRKGETGDWKNWFTVALAEELDNSYAEKMAGTKIFHRYLKGTS